MAELEKYRRGVTRCSRYPRALPVGIYESMCLSQKLMNKVAQPKGLGFELYYAWKQQSW